MVPQRAWVLLEGLEAGLPEGGARWADAALLRARLRARRGRLLDHGVPEKVAMQIVGWKTRAIFYRYSIVNEADVREAMQKRFANGTVATQFSGSAAAPAA